MSLSAISIIESMKYTDLLFMSSSREKRINDDRALNTSIIRNDPRMACVLFSSMDLHFFCKFQ